MCAFKKQEQGQCQLCGRHPVIMTKHHLTPKELGGTLLPTAMLCIPCHKQIHALYTNEEIAARLTTIKELQADPKLAKFLKWIRKQPAERLPRTRKSNDRKKYR
ncbi:MAG: HNH endonuclease [Bacillus sp. (in: firmicutes)]